MRHNQNRRSRGRSNRKGPNPLTRSYESNGPDVKVRGTASHVADKYMTLARDAQASGDPVSAENYLQHAEHYNRIVMAAQAQFQQQQPQFREGGPDDFYDDDRQMNGRPRDRFEFNGEGRPGGDEEGEERFEAGEGGEEDRGFRPPMQSRPHDQDQRGPRGPRPDRFDRNDRRDRGERYDRGDRPDYRGEGGQRPDRFQRAEEPLPEAAPAPAPAPVEAVAHPPSDEAPAQPRRRRGRPRNDDQGAEGETSDGAAALAAFPDR